MRMLSIMARSKKKGYLLDGEKQMESKTLAKIAGSSDEEITPLLDELEAHGVYSRSPENIIYNRRMVREAEISSIRSLAGKRGGRPKSKTKANEKQHPKQHVKAPSASASASASSSLRNKKDESPKIILILDEEPKRWEGITEGDKALWAKSYPGCDIEQVLQEMIAYWDAQPRSHLKLNWKRTIVNRLKSVQDQRRPRGGGEETSEEFMERHRKAMRGE